MADLLRQDLRPFVSLFQGNAADLFPHKIDHPEKQTYQASSFRRKAVRRDRPKWKDSSNIDELPSLFEAFAEDLAKFHICLRELREVDVMDDAIASIEKFENDLKVRESTWVFMSIFDFRMQYWASCLRDHKCKYI